MSSPLERDESGSILKRLSWCWADITSLRTNARPQWKSSAMTRRSGTPGSRTSRRSRHSWPRVTTTGAPCCGQHLRVGGRPGWHPCGSAMGQHHGASGSALRRLESSRRHHRLPQSDRCGRRLPHQRLCTQGDDRLRPGRRRGRVRAGPRSCCHRQRDDAYTAPGTRIHPIRCAARCSTRFLDDAAARRCLNAAP